MSILNIFNRRNRILLKELTKTDFKLRYQGSVLGYLWALLRPLMMFAVLYVVFGQILRFGGDIPHFPVYLLLGTVMWSFFTECTGQGIQAIVQRGELLRKISFPKWVVVMSATLTALINLFINLGVVIIFALINGVTPSLNWFLMIPILLEFYVLSLGISFLLGAINVKYRDITSIWDVVTQALFYAIPIIYPISLITATSETVAKILLVNPIAQIIQDARYCLITQQTDTVWNFISTGWIQMIPIVTVIVISILAAIFFRKKSRRFAEEV